MKNEYRDGVGYEEMNRPSAVSSLHDTGVDVSRMGCLTGKDRPRDRTKGPLWRTLPHALDVEVDDGDRVDAVCPHCYDAKPEPKLLPYLGIGDFRITFASCE
jgi:hypothetical protein